MQISPKDPSMKHGLVTFELYIFIKLVICIPTSKFCVNLLVALFPIWADFPAGYSALSLLEIEEKSSVNKHCHLLLT